MYLPTIVIKAKKEVNTYVQKKKGVDQTIGHLVAIKFTTMIVSVAFIFIGCFMRYVFLQRKERFTWDLQDLPPQPREGVWSPYPAKATLRKSL